MNLVLLPTGVSNSFVIQDETIAFPGFHMYSNATHGPQFFISQHQRAEQYYSREQLAEMRTFADEAIVLMKITKRMMT